MDAPLLSQSVHISSEEVSGESGSHHIEVNWFGEGWAGWRFAGMGLVYLYMLPVVLPSLGCYFGPDDVTNLYYHRFGHPPAEAFVKSVLLFLPYRRPVGGCVYLLLYSIFGLSNPLPYYITGLVIVGVNAALLFWLLLRLTRSTTLAILACCIASVHGVLTEIWYNFGTIYDMLAFGLILASFHLYLFYRAEKGKQRWAFYSAALALYWLAIGAKEMAVTLPALLAVYEWVYETRRQKGWSFIYVPVIRLIPFFSLALVASLGRLLADPYKSSLYVYHLDGRILDNLCRYIEKLSYQSFILTRGQMLLVLACSLAAAVLLRNRHMIFGWIYFLISLSPVIALPRVSDFFLYIPMVGLGLYIGSLLVEVGSRLWQSIHRVIPSAVRLSFLAPAAGISICLFGMIQLHHARIRSNVQRTVLAWGADLERFDRQLFSKYVDFPRGTALLFLRKPHVDFTLHSTVHLHYCKSESELRVWAPPVLDFEAFRQVSRSAPETHVFDYDQGKLVELDSTAAAEAQHQSEEKESKSQRGASPR